QAAVKQDHRSSRAFGRHQTTALDQLADGIMIDGPQRIAGGGDVVLSVEHADFVAAWNEHQWAVELIDFIQKDGHVHGARLRHEVVSLPGAIVLMPLPEVALEGHLTVDLELMHVHGLAKDLHHRRDHTRMAGELSEWRAVHVRRKVRAHRLTALLAY